MVQCTPKHDCGDTTATCYKLWNLKQLIPISTIALLPVT